jgi:flagellar L-ring protein precursor FlgH
MIRRIPGAATIAAFALAVQGCAGVVPFVPMIAHATPRILFPNHGHSANAPSDPPDPPDPAIEKAVSAVPAAVAGPADRGAYIGQQDAVAFVPDSPGSIPLRVSAVDMVSDYKAHAVGDIVTVKVVESINGESSAKTDLSNKRSIQAGVPNLFTATESLAAHNPLLNLVDMIQGSSNNSATGSGDMTAADTFTATVSAVVVAVNPGGTLSIRGDRQVRINGEDDTIHLSGVVRPEDIDSNDTVASQNVADLRVSITGSGEIRDKQGDGWGTRVVDWLWMF